MQLIACPWCGPREETEFHYGGEAHVAYPADPQSLTDEEWAHYVFFRSNPKGLFTERWSHTPDAGAGSTPFVTPPPTDSTACTAWTSRNRRNP